MTAGTTRRASSGVCAVLLCAVVACGTATKPDNTPEQATHAGEAPFVFAKRPRNDATSTKQPSSRSRDSNPASGRAWSIVLLTFTGPNAEQAARESLARLSTQTNFNEGFIEQRAGGWVLAHGSYSGPNDQRAKNDLAALKEVVPGAMLVPGEQAVASGANPDWDLSTVKARYGDKAVRTLQVAIYRHADRLKTPTPQELAQFRDAAEQAVAQLRAQGDEAFYYHGPYGSTVTVGIFGDKDVITAVRNPETGVIEPLPRPRESMAIQAARQRHPRNLLNGAPVLEKVPGTGEQREQASFLVRIPD